ncbi:MAG: GTPase HflX [Deltaproteobacteria bacterium]|nr:GTPase HflX [Deltaproteobacteria bacterium]MBI4196384.1 GTPase HflX [Deltaproteobacteria bacterium]
MRQLVSTAGAEVVGELFFELREIHPATLIGHGKAEEIRDQVRSLGVDIVVVDEDLSPTQNRNLEDIFATKVVDRTGIILDIFASRARSREGKIQVELAQLKYLLPRLSGHGREFSRLGGGIGTRGPGETQLEADQRKVRDKISVLTDDLLGIRAHRQLHRRKREGVPLPTVSLVGYTNAGKSTLMNCLTGAGVPVEDKLFVTLDPTVRRLKLPSGREILLADTVGFVRKLPHELIEAFQATFEEALSSDLLLHVIDMVRPHGAGRIQIVEKVFKELGMDEKPVIRVFNKVDKDSGFFPEGVDRFPDDLVISALRGDGREELLKKIDQKLAESFRQIMLMIPHASGSELSLLYATSRILEREDRREGVLLQAEVSEKYFNKFQKFRTSRGK